MTATWVSELDAGGSRRGQHIVVGSHRLRIERAEQYELVLFSQRGKHLQSGVSGWPVDLPGGGSLSSIELRDYNHHRSAPHRLWRVGGLPVFVAWNPDRTRFYTFTAPWGSDRTVVMEAIVEVESARSQRPPMDRLAVEMLVGLAGAGPVHWWPMSDSVRP